MLRILQQYPVSDNPPITYFHQLLTPLPVAALLFATLPAYSLTSKRLGAHLSANCGNYDYPNMGGAK